MSISHGITPHAEAQTTLYRNGTGAHRNGNGAHSKDQNRNRKDENRNESPYALIAREVRESGVLARLSCCRQSILLSIADMARWDSRSPEYRQCYFSKAKLANQLGITPGTVYRAVKFFLQTGILSEVGKQPVRINGALAYELTIYRVADAVELYDIMQGEPIKQSARPMDSAALERMAAAKVERQINTPPDPRITPPPDPGITPPPIRGSHPPRSGDHTPPDPGITQKEVLKLAVEVDNEKGADPVLENGDKFNGNGETSKPPARAPAPPPDPMIPESRPADGPDNGSGYRARNGETPAPAAAAAPTPLVRSFDQWEERLLAASTGDRVALMRQAAMQFGEPRPPDALVTLADQRLQLRQWEQPPTAP